MLCHKVSHFSLQVLKTGLPSIFNSKDLLVVSMGLQRGGQTSKHVRDMKSEKLDNTFTITVLICSLWLLVGHYAEVVRCLYHYAYTSSPLHCSTAPSVFFPGSIFFNMPAKITHICHTPQPAKTMAICSIIWKATKTQRQLMSETTETLPCWAEYITNCWVDWILSVIEWLGELLKHNSAWAQAGQVNSKSLG